MHKANKKLILTVLFIVFVIGLSFGLGFWTDAVQGLGRHFSDPHMTRGYIYAFIWSSIIGFILILFPFHKEIHKDILWAWGLRVLVTLFFMIFYESYYLLDSTVYFREAKNAIGSLPEFGNGSEIIIWMSQYIYKYIPLADSYHSLKVFWSLFGFIGIYLFYSGYSNYVNKHSKPIFWALNLFPSILFWSSIYGKDPLVILGLGLFFYGVVMHFKHDKLYFLIIALIGLLIASYIRVWLAGIFMVPYMVSMLISKRNSNIVKILLVALSGVTYVFVVQPYLNRFNITNLSSFLSTIDTMSKLWSRGGSGQAVQTISGIKDFFMYLPKGAFTAIFRPLPGEINNPFGILSGFENLALLVYTLSYLVKYNSRLFKKEILVYMVLTIMAWTGIYAFISPQNLGTAVRFKLQILPFIVLLPFFAEHALKSSQATKAKDSESLSL